MSWWGSLEVKECFLVDSGNGFWIQVINQSRLINHHQCHVLFFFVPWRYVKLYPECNKDKHSQASATFMDKPFTLLGLQRPIRDDLLQVYRWVFSTYLNTKNGVLKDWGVWIFLQQKIMSHLVWNMLLMMLFIKRYPP